MDSKPSCTQRGIRDRSSQGHFSQGRRGAKRRRGTYTVEFALCASLLFLMIFGMLELSRYLFVRQAVDQAAYEAARVGIVPGATEADIRARGESLLAAAGIANTTMTVNPTTIDDTTRTVTVEITCQFDDNSFVPSNFLGDQLLIKGRTTLDHENQAFLIPEDAANSGSLNENDEPLDV